MQKLPVEARGRERGMSGMWEMAEAAKLRAGRLEWQLLQAQAAENENLGRHRRPSDPADPPHRAGDRPERAPESQERPKTA